MDTVQTNFDVPEAEVPKRLPVKRLYDSPVLLKADEMFGTKRTESGAGNYTAAELRKAMRAIEKRGKKNVDDKKSVVQPLAGPG